MKADKIYNFALWMSLGLLPLIIFFLWENNYSINAPIDDGKFGTFGDFVGGVLGSIWSLCGVLLFYSALKEQREDFNTNKQALQKQIEALEVQTNEFRLQRQELKESRQVFIDQSKTLRQQRLDSTYFSLLSLYKEVISELDEKAGGDYFKTFREQLFDRKVLCGEYVNNHNEIASRYLDLFYQHKQELSHYFKLVYRIVKIVDDYDIEEVEKFRYVKIFRSQLSENELLAIYYNSHSRFGKESYKLVLKYNLLKHLPVVSKVEFQYYLLNAAEKEVFAEGGWVETEETVRDRSVALMEFNDLFEEYLARFLGQLQNLVLKEDFEEVRVSRDFYGDSGFLLVFKSYDSNEIKVIIKNLSDEFLSSKFDLSLQDFSSYMKSLIYDLLVYSRYIEFSDIEEICAGTAEHECHVQCTLSKKLVVNLDIE